MQIDIAYCGGCHSDLHQVCSTCVGEKLYLCVSGHEIASGEATRFKVGDTVSVGSRVNSANI